MPKQVDRDERRRAIAEAVLRLVTTRGIEAASLRTVAAEAGVSMGAVQHYFTTKAEMLLFALEYGNGVLAIQVQELIAECQPTTLRDTLRMICTLLLPRTADSRAGARLWAALIARGCVDEPTGKLAADAYANLTNFMARSVAEAAKRQETPGGLDVMQAAREMVSVIDGVRWPLLFGVYTEAEAVQLLDARLDQIFAAG